METKPVLSDDLTINKITDDELVELFSYFSGEELLSMQEVCSRWNIIISTMINWKCIFERKVKSCPDWEEVWKSFTISTSEMPSSYKAQFEMIYKKIQVMGSNWRRGKFTEMDIDISGERYEHASDDYLVHTRGQTIVVYDRRKLQIALQKRLGYKPYAVRVERNLLFTQKNNRDYIIFDVTNGKQFQITVPQVRDSMSHVAINSKMMAIVYRGEGSTPFDSVLQLWQKEDERYELVSEEIFYDKEIRVDMDDCYMALYEGLSGQRFRPGLNWHFTVHFSRDSVVERSMSVPVRGKTFLYSRGYFYLIHKSGEIRIMEVRSGKWIRTIQHPVWIRFKSLCQFLLWSPVAVNSKFLVAVDGTTEYLDWTVTSTVRIYDLLAAKDPTCDSNNFLLTTIHNSGFRFRQVNVNEREIWGHGGNYLRHHFCFKSFNFLERGSGRQVITNITHRRAVRKPARYGQ